LLRPPQISNTFSEASAANFTDSSQVSQQGAINTDLVHLILNFILFQSIEERKTNCPAVQSGNVASTTYVVIHPRQNFTLERQDMVQKKNTSLGYAKCYMLYYSWYVETCQGNLKSLFLAQILPTTMPDLELVAAAVSEQGTAEQCTAGPQ